jgi:hypothetical protein
VIPTTQTWSRATWLALVAATPALAQDSVARGVTYGLEVAFSSGHADRGFLISDRAVIQPVTWVGWNGLGLSLWNSLPLTANSDGSRPHITELELTQTRRWGRLTLAPALRMYYYRDALSRERDHSLEGWLNVSLAVGPFSFFVNPSIDVLTYKGAYFVDAGVESERRVSPHLELGGSVRAGWASWRFNNEYVEIPKSTLDRVRGAAWLTAYVTPHFYIGPLLEYNVTVDRDVRAVTGPNYLLIRVAVGGEF